MMSEACGEAARGRSYVVGRVRHASGRIGGILAVQERFRNEVHLELVDIIHVTASTVKEALQQWKEPAEQSRLT